MSIAARFSNQAFAEGDRAAVGKPKLPAADRAHRRRFGLPWAGLLALFSILAPAARLNAQATWEYSPYRIRLWIAFDRSPELTEQLREQIAASVQQRSYAIAGASWDIRVSACPATLRSEAARGLDRLTFEALEPAVKPRLEIDDKLIVLSVRAEPNGFRIQARELDCRSRILAAVVRRQTVQPSRIADEAFLAVRQAFTPLVRIEQVKDREATVRVRAGGLIQHSSNPCYIQDQDVLRPVIRRNDRLGQPLENGIAFVPWTFLTVGQRDGNVLYCPAHSGMYSALAVRTSARTQKLALISRPLHARTQLRLVERGEHPAPLPGYEIYSKDPRTDETRLLGPTDWRGEISVQRDDRPLQILYVRNGGQLLGRLPIMPGLEPALTAELRNDNRRLEAEGYVKGMQNTIMDLVARRELYIVRFRRHLKAKEFDEAKSLLEEFGALRNRSDLTRELLQQGQRFSSGDINDRREQAKIDEMFKATQQLLTRFLDPGTSDELAAQLAQARSAS